MSQVPMMEETSPYRRVHAPHLNGYFLTIGMRFSLVPLAGGRTRLMANSAHLLRIDPVLYWQPMARWALDRNLARVLGSIRKRAEGSALSLAHSDAVALANGRARHTL